jgi:pimeloyl-ACP methyl ester carboxylesterase
MDMPARPTLLLLHGPGQNPTSWQPVVDHLDPDRPMFAPWVRGGKPNQSGPNQAAPDLDLAEASADLANTIELRGIERADLVGVVTSGLVALQTAIAEPGKVAHVVLIDTPLLPPVAQLKMSRRLMALMPQSAFGDMTKQQALASLDALIDSGLRVDLARVEAPVLALYSHDNPAGPASAALLAPIDATIRHLPAPMPGEMVARLIQAFTDGRPLPDTPDRPDAPDAPDAPA